jgi:hypothetical protein
MNNILEAKPEAFQALMAAGEDLGFVEINS